MKDIDVSECCYLVNYDPPKGQGNWCGAIHKGACKVYSKDCEYNENCYYKQLKRLEQKNKQLKEKNTKIVNENIILLQEYERIQEENEQLKEEISKFRWDNPYFDLYNNVVNQRDMWEEKSKQYKSCLQEIKEIAEKTIDIYYPDYYDEGFEEDIVTEFGKQVLDLITKLEEK